MLSYYATGSDPAATSFLRRESTVRFSASSERAPRRSRSPSTAKKVSIDYRTQNARYVRPGNVVRIRKIKCRYQFIEEQKAYTGSAALRDDVSMIAMKLTNS
ncbi:MAG: hypothetical protein A2487_08775 [Candidatus Raymondbacteria bacterium RifOxyC12_full_50_8]|nr:MAG: hypothetical protein A2487_08775 [Candidatus Raymondbacteria bacterium RifOxyC12_full_50_8]